MRTALFVALLASPVGAVTLRWAPALGEALPAVDGPAAQGFDAPALAGLEIKPNELDALAREGIGDLDGLRRKLAAGPADARLVALERSLTVFAPVIARLEARNVRPGAKALPAAFRRALEDEVREDDRRALALASRYGEGPLERQLMDSSELDALLRDRYPYLSPGAFDAAARVYDSKRTTELAARRDAQARPVAMVSDEDRVAMRDAVADVPPAKKLGLFSRLKRRVKGLLRSGPDMVPQGVTAP